MIIFQGGG